MVIGFGKALGRQNTMITNKATSKEKPEVKEGTGSGELGANKTAKEDKDGDKAKEEKERKAKLQIKDAGMGQNKEDFEVCSV